ncbi:MAG: imidazole glycerol phosphate synthase subunit HisH [Phycisphaeraceae bacterium]|nr:imidazole glycerol phosphate synthase subunit HisH [Phycisphaeraceae bacterium]
MGNLRSVQKAFEHVGADARILSGPGEVSGVAKLVLPGVGAFADGMTNLRKGGWISAIEEFIGSGKPFLGICLGLQLLFEGSEEDAPDGGKGGKLVPGLGVLPGQVVQFRQSFDAQGQPRIKIPHMGWNTLQWRRADPLLAGLEQGIAVYFVHSYYARPTESEAQGLISATAQYPQGQAFCSSVWRGNVWATQFHPEKSQRVGLRMLQNFASW